MDIDKDLVKKLKDNPYFIEFKEFIVSNINDLNSIGDLKNKTNLKAGETVRARAIASDILRDILKPFIDFNENSEPTAKQIQAAKDRVGL